MTRITYLNDTEIYEGELKNAIPCGEGKYTFADGSYYAGSFKDGHFHGKGVLFTADGAPEYEGDWENGYYHGKGKRYYENGDVYEGDFRLGKRHGKGTYSYKCGSCYEGSWKEDLFDGKGVYTAKDGTVIYTGEFKQGAKHGPCGKLAMKKGERYEGGFYYGSFHGDGVIFNDADELAAAEAEGYSCLVKTEYSFRKGEIKGSVTYNFSNGEKITLKNMDGVIRGTKTMENGVEYTGELKGSRPHGYGVYSFPDKNGNTVRSYGFYKDGRPHGKMIIFSAGGVRTEGLFKDGLENGSFTHYYPGGATRCENYKKGKRCV